MKTYKVVAEEVIQLECEVEAESAEEALEKVKAGEVVEWTDWSGAEFTSDLRFDRAIVFNEDGAAEIDLDQQVRDADGVEHEGHETYRRKADGTLERITHNEEAQDEETEGTERRGEARLRLVN